MDGWMDGARERAIDRSINRSTDTDFAIFDSISFISERLEGDNERLCATESRLRGSKD